MRRLLLFIIVLTSVSVKANDLAPVPVQSVTPDQTWFYNLEDVVFSSSNSYVPNGQITYTKWYVNGVLQTQGSYYRSMSICFALPGTPANGCYQLASGQTTVQVKLEVQSNHGLWDDLTITYTILEHKGRKYFVKDHLGSIRTTVNRDGNVLGYDDYYAFGLQMPGRSSNSANPNDDYKFTGHERYDEAGLTIDYMNARTYDPILGRFMQIDPLADQFPGWTPYHYVHNNPLNLIDPTGMSACDPPTACLEDGTKIDGDLAARAVMTSLYEVKHSFWESVLNSSLVQSITGVSPGEGKRFEVGFSKDNNGNEVIASEINVVDKGTLIEEGINNLTNAANVLSGGANPTGLLTKTGAKQPVVSSLSDQATQLSKQLNKNSVSVGTPTGKLHFDLKGASHKGVATPHVQKSIYNTNPVTGVTHLNKDSKWVRPMTQQDLRAIKRVIKERIK